MQTSKRLTLALALAALLPLGAQAADETDIEARVAAAKATTAAFVKELGGAMMKEMKAGGPTAAIAVCRDLAPAIANRHSLDKGWKITRVGTRVRNPMLGTPDVWEAEVLEDFAERAAAGEKYASMAHFEVVEEPSGRYLRFAKAIGTAPQCLVCHGEKSQIPDPVMEKINSAYPHDEAVGYAAGELRGAVSIKQPLD